MKATILRDQLLMSPDSYSSISPNPSISSEYSKDDPERPYAFQAHAVPILFLVLLTAWIRIPTIGEGMPYFSAEDEAHHFNRTVRMVQSGDFNPHYFHKPSLHFYLRMPVVAASFLWSVREGHIRKIQNIETKDSFGIGGYAFTASHAGIVKWNRAFSVLLLLGTVVMLYLLMIQLGAPPLFALIAPLFFSLSPNAYLYSTVIGVDIVVTFFAIATVLATVIVTPATKEKPQRWGFLLAVLLAGLTISTKYNALPIIAVPLLASLFTPQLLIERFLVTCIGIPVGFLLGSPYILAELPLFLNHFAYEIWHYGVAGHVGHQAEPGVEQAIFYLRWLLSEGFGPIGGVFVILGVAITFLHQRAFTAQRVKLLLTALFPLLFLLLMISQRANFTRNMLVALPLLAVFIGVTISWVATLRIPFRLTISAVLTVLALFPPLLTTMELRAYSAARSDSRGYSCAISSSKVSREYRVRRRALALVLSSAIDRVS
jgi:4-amino-4-deoxy-L-arabinose transferase-like glycosyltransferase